MGEGSGSCMVSGGLFSAAAPHHPRETSNVCGASSAGCGQLGRASYSPGASEVHQLFRDPWIFLGLTKWDGGGVGRDSHPFVRGQVSLCQGG